MYPVDVQGIFEGHHFPDEVLLEVGMDEVGSNVEDHGWELVWVLCGENGVQFWCGGFDDASVDLGGHLLEWFLHVICGCLVHGAIQVQAEVLCEVRVRMVCAMVEFFR